MTWSQVHEFGHDGRSAVSDVGDMEWDALECVDWEWVSPHGVVTHLVDFHDTK